VLHIPFLTREVVEQEVQAIRKVCGEIPHPNIVAVFKHGILLNTPYYFIDMELCSISLAEYISTPPPAYPSQRIPYFVKGAPPPFRAQQIWNVMKQLACGVKYLHHLNLVHRDLKPANGMRLYGG
jgi:serine/threonine protein kinase